MKNEKNSCSGITPEWETPGGYTVSGSPGISHAEAGGGRKKAEGEKRPRRSRGPSGRQKTDSFEKN